MIYIMSDIHGLYSRYTAMLKKIGLKDEDRLFVLGDVIDRGKQSFEILFDIMERKNTELFLGNHEHMMLTYLNGTDMESWFYGVNGGEYTCRRFREFDEDTRKRIVSYLIEETTIVRNLDFPDQRYILSHTSAITDGIDRYTRDYADDLMAVQDLVWNMSYPDSITSLPAKEPCEKKTVLISGHIITQRLNGKDEVYIDEYDNGYTWMDIDCGCAMGERYGRLACLQIDDTGKIADILYVK